MGTKSKIPDSVSPPQKNSAPTVVGAYATQPADKTLRPQFVEAVLSLPKVSGLEIPFAATPYFEDESWLWSLLPVGSQNILTLIGATMEGLQSEPQFGLASPNLSQRKNAMNLLKKALAVSTEANDTGKNIVAIEVHSGPQLGTREAFYDSLSEAASWDWGPTKLTVEHCDSYKDGLSEAKGFLSLAEEISVIEQVNQEAEADIGLTINWGRSAIDSGSPEGPVRDLEKVRQHSLLQGLMFSGASNKSGIYGKAWADCHLPAYSCDSFAGAEDSLMTPKRIVQCLEVADKQALFTGVKISVSGTESSSLQRIANISKVLDLLP